MLRNSLIIISYIALSACAGVSSVVSMGEGKYFLAKSGTMGWSSGGQQKAKALAEAEAFCMTQNGYVKLIESNDSGAGGYGKISSADIEFECASEE